MRRYDSKAWLFRYTAPCSKLLLISIVVFVFTITGYVIIYHLFPTYLVGNIPFNKVCPIFIAMAVINGILLITSTVLVATQSNASRIRYKVIKGLFAYPYGNPLHLKDGQILPKITCTSANNGRFILNIYATTVTVEDIQNTAPNISSILNRKFERYAVTISNADVALNYVQFTIEDVMIDNSMHFTNVNQMKTDRPIKIMIDNKTHIDLTTSGSMLVAGKTRSGKTTGIISIIIQVLLQGRDTLGSNVTIIDPKRAELSVLPHTVTVDSDGEAIAILQALKTFAQIMTERQEHLNKLSIQYGDAINWWDFDVRPCFLFIDEYVACRSLFPKKAEKNSDYCHATFDALIKRIVTMGASAGCYVIISIAEASVDEGGLPTMLKNAMSTKILFRPTLTEGRLMWNSEKLKMFPERVYKQGDAWFSSTDGVHDDVSFVHFPYLDFPVYRELGLLLTEYYM